MTLSGGRLENPTRIFFKKLHGVWFFQACERPFTMFELTSWGFGTRRCMERMARKMKLTMGWAEA